MHEYQLLSIIKHLANLNLPSLVINCETMIAEQGSEGDVLSTVAFLAAPKSADASSEADVVELADPIACESMEIEISILVNYGILHTMIILI